MSVENVSVVGNIKTLKGRFIAHKFSGYWVDGGCGEECVEKKKSVAGQWPVYSEVCQKRIAELKH